MATETQTTTTQSEPAAAASTEAKPAATALAAAKSEGDKPAEAAGDKPVEGKTDGEAKDAKSDKAKPEGAPEKYADFKVPDGVEMDKGALEAFLPVAKEIGLSQEAAQKLIDFQAGMISKAKEGQVSAWAETHKGWRVAADKEFFGASKKESEAAIAAARDTFGDAEFAQIMEDTRVGDHPALLRFMVKVGKAVSEGTKLNTGGSRAAGEGKSVAETLFPSMA